MVSKYRDILEPPVTPRPPSPVKIIQTNGTGIRSGSPTGKTTLKLLHFYPLFFIIKEKLYNFHNFCESIIKYETIFIFRVYSRIYSKYSKRLSALVIFNICAHNYESGPSQNLKKMSLSVISYTTNH